MARTLKTARQAKAFDRATLAAALRDAFVKREGADGGLWSAYCALARLGVSAEDISADATEGLDKASPVRKARMSTCRVYAKVLREAGGIVKVPEGMSYRAARDLAPKAAKGGDEAAAGEPTAKDASPAKAAKVAAPAVAAGWQWADGLAANIARHATAPDGMVRVDLPALAAVLREAGYVIAAPGMLPDAAAVDRLDAMFRRVGRVIGGVPTLAEAAEAAAEAEAEAEERAKARKVPASSGIRREARNKREQAAAAATDAAKRAESEAEFRGITDPAAIAALGDALGAKVRAPRKGRAKAVAA